jgi:hypothetical protein
LRFKGIAFQLLVTGTYRDFLILLSHFFSHRHGLRQRVVSLFPTGRVGIDAVAKAFILFKITFILCRFFLNFSHYYFSSFF